MTKILFFTTAIEHTTFRKTAKMLQNEGAVVHVIGFTRNNFPIGKDDLSVESLGELSHGNYISRIFKLIKFLFILRKRSKDFDVIYNFTLDTLIISRIALLFNKKTWIYQVQDIRAIYFGNSLKNKLARFLEKWFINKADLLVVSSLDYYEEFFKKIYFIDSDKVFVLENKLEKENGSFNKKLNFNIEKESITIGYFGVMRCGRSWEILKLLACKFENSFDIYLRGKPLSMPDIEKDIEGISNINFGGLYKSPDDLAELYGLVDIVWACYPFSDSSDGNWRMARTIRFYEALAYGRPVIVQKGTAQEKDVIKYDIGLVVDMANVLQTLKELNSISNESIKRWRENIDKLDTSTYFYTNEYEKLFYRISKIN